MEAVLLLAIAQRDRLNKAIAALGGEPTQTVSVEFVAPPSLTEPLSIVTTHTPQGNGQSNGESVTAPKSADAKPRRGRRGPDGGETQKEKIGNATRAILQANHNAPMPVGAIIPKLAEKGIIIDPKKAGNVHSALRQSPELFRSLGDQGYVLVGYAAGA